MAETVHELVARVRPEGISQTEDELDQFSETFEEVSQEAGETAGVLADFSDRWQGAANVLIASLAVLATGLLSKVPILGEVAAGLGTIIDSIAIKMDSVLRPALQPLSNLLFDIATAIDETQGPLGTFIGLLGTLASVSAVVLGAIQGLYMAGLTSVSAFAALSSVWGTIVSVGSTVVSVIAGIVAGISAVTAAVIIAVAAIIAFAAAYITNFRGIRDKTNAFIGNMIDSIKGFVDDALTFFEILWINGKAAIAKLGAVVETILTASFQTAVNAIAGAVNAIISKVENGINRTIKQLNRLPKINLKKASIGRVQTGEPVTNPQATITRKFAAIDRRARNQRQEARGTNRFADRQTVEIKMDPQARKVISAQMDEGPANRGR